MDRFGRCERCGSRSYMLASERALYLRRAAPQVIRLEPVAPSKADGAAGNSVARWRLIIADNGCGFDPPCVKPAHGHGLNNIETRAQELGGQSRIETAPGQGAKIVVEFPNPATAAS